MFEVSLSLDTGEGETMGNDGSLQKTPLANLEASLQQLLEITASCVADRLLDPHVVQFELLSLKNKVSEAEAKQDQTQVEECLEECKQLLAYCTALRKQLEGAQATSYPPHLLLQRLKKSTTL